MTDYLATVLPPRVTETACTDGRWETVLFLLVLLVLPAGIGIGHLLSLLANREVKR